MEKSTTLPKKCIFSVFHIVRYQNAKKHAEPPICGSETTLPETCLLNVLECVRYQNAKKHGKPPKWEYYQKRVFKVLLSFLRTKTQNTL